MPPCTCPDCSDSCYVSSFDVDGEEHKHGRVMPRQIEKAGSDNYPTLCAFHADVRRAKSGAYIGTQKRGSEPPEPVHTERLWNPRMDVIMEDGSVAIVHPYRFDERGELG